MASIAEIVGINVGKPSAKTKFVELIFDALMKAYEEAASYVQVIEDTRGGLNVEHLLAMRNHYQLCSNLNADLGLYTSEFAGIDEIVREMDDSLDKLGTRFRERRDRVDTISVSDACTVYSRSKSTIYRWIKNGKLNAEKQGRRWVIFI